MADIGALSLTMTVTNAAGTTTKLSYDPTDHQDAAVDEFRSEIMTATNGVAVDVFAAGALGTSAILIVCNRDGANDVDLTWDDLDANSNTQSIGPAEFAVVTCDPATAPTLAGDGGDCLCEVAYYGT